MKIPDKIAVGGADQHGALRCLTVVVEEMHRRAQQLRDAGQAVWTGPPLHLVVDEVHQLADNGECWRLFEQILRQGRAVGVTGVARGPANRFGYPDGVSGFARDMFAVGVPLRFEATQ
jgi:hypothetical protein